MALKTLARVRKTPSVAQKSPDGINLPRAVRDTLQNAGIGDDAVLRAQSDLDSSGHWGERYLIATPERLLVLSVGAEVPTTNGAPAALPVAAETSEREREAASGIRSDAGTLALRDSQTGHARDAEKVGRVAIELDVPIQDIVEAEAKSLVGSSSLEVRFANGTARTFARNDAITLAKQNGHVAQDGQVETADGGHERVVEIFRSSNAHAKSLGRVARQIEELRDTGALDEDPAEAEKWARATCDNCGRALPENSLVCPFCVNRWRAMKRLFTYVMPYLSIAISNFLLSVAGQAVSFVPPLVFAYLVDHVFTQKTGKIGIVGRIVGTHDPYRALSILVGMMVVIGLAGAIIAVVRGRSVAFLGARVLHDLRAELYAHLQRLSMSYFDKREVGAVMSRVQNDVGMIQNFLLDGAENIILSTLTIAIVLGILLTRSWQLTLLVLIPVPFVIIGTNTYWRGLRKLWRRVWHQNSALGARLADTLGGVRVVRAFAQESREVARFIDKSGELRDATMSVEQKAAVFYPTLGFIMGLGGPLIYYFGGRQIIGGTMSLGDLTLITFMLGRLYEPIQQLTRLVNFTTRAMTAAERIFEVLDTEPEVQQADDAIPMPNVKGKVEFKDVVFGYEKHRPVMHGISLNIEPGEMIGLVGHSGAGKSTLINLLMRFYDVSEGSIEVDGVDLRRIVRDDIRNQIGIVLQEPYLFHGSVAENIAYGNPDATMSEIMGAAKAAFAHNFIVGFPDGYDTLVGERGTRLSGGERQRISIARAILHNPRILILDEATASVDTETEQQIQGALRNLTRGRTTIAIAHRLSTLRDASRLLVLEAGNIVEQGTHDELMAKRGVFYKLVNAQRAMNEVVALNE